MKIGFYNDKIDNISNLSECDVIFNNYIELKEKIKKDDILILSSDLSLFDLELKEALELIDNYNLTMLMAGSQGVNTALNNLKIQTTLVAIEYIKANKDNLLKVMK